MAGEFRMAGAYVEVNLKDNTQADERKIRARLESGQPVRFDTALNDPKNVARIKKAVESGRAAKLPTEAENPIDAAWRKSVQASLKATIADSLQIPISARTERFRRDLAAVVKEVETGLEADIPVGVADASRFRREVQLLAHLASEEVKVRVPVDVDKSKARVAGRQAGDAIGGGIGDGLRRSGEPDRATEKVAQRAQAKFKGMQFLGAFAGLPVAAAAAGVATAAALSGVALLFAGIGVAAVASSFRVQQAVKSMADRVGDDVKAMAVPMEETVVKAVDMVGDSFTRLKPQIQTALNASQGPLLTFTDGLTQLAERAMPGFVVATQNSQAPMRGLASVLAQTGSGITDFFTNLSTGAAGSERVMVTVGGVIQDLLGFAGQLFANLANNGNPVLQQFRSALQQVYGVIGTVTAAGSSLYSFVSGFLATVSGGLGIVQGFASALGGWAGPLGHIGGSLFAVQRIAGLFGQSLGQAGFGIGAFTKTVNDGTQMISPFKAALNGAEGAGGKFSAGLSSIRKGGLNPLGIAMIAGGFLLDLFGRKQQEAAKKASEHRSAVNDLTEAIQRDNGVLGQSVQAVTTKALTDKNAYNNAKNFGVSMEQVSAAALGQTGAFDQVVGKAKSYVAEMLLGYKTNQQMVPSVMAVIDSFAKQGGNAADTVRNLTAVRMHSVYLTDSQKALLTSVLDGVAAMGEQGRATLEAERKAAALQAAMDKLSSATAREMTPAMFAAAAASSNLKNAFEGLNKTGGDVASKGQAIIDIMDQLAGKPKTAEEALQSFNDNLRGIGDAFKSIKEKGGGFPKDMIDTAGAISSVSEAGSKLKDVVEQGAVDMASYGQALKDSGMPADEITGKLGGLRDRLAEQLKLLGLTPPQIDSVLAHYGAVPKDVVTTMRLEGDKEAQQQIEHIKTELASVPASKGVKVDALTDGAKDSLLAMHNIIVKLPDGTFRVFANTTEGKAAAEALVNQVGSSYAEIGVGASTKGADYTLASFINATNGKAGIVTIDANSNPASGKVTLTKQYADGTTGTMAVDARIDKATGKLQVARTNADGTTGWITIDGLNQPAFGKLFEVQEKAKGVTALVPVDANTAEAQAKIASIQALGNATHATATVFANSDPANGEVRNWQNLTRTIQGDTTTFTNTDPATGAVTAWKVVTDGTGATTTTMAQTDPATGRVTAWKRNTDGTWAVVSVDARTDEANAAIERVARDRVITFRARFAGVGPNSGSSNQPGLAAGGILAPFAEGGIAAFDSGGFFGGLTPMDGGLAAMVPRNTWRLIGDNMQVPEAYIPIDPGSKRSQALLDRTNDLMGREAGTSVAVMERPAAPAAGPPAIDYAKLAAVVGGSVRAAFDGATVRFDNLERGVILAAREWARR
jgi:hypothetical protein